MDLFAGSNNYNDNKNMILTPIVEVQKLPEGYSLEYVQGKITKIEPYISAKQPSADPKKSVPFNCQRIHLTDDSGTIMVKFWERTEIPPDRIGAHVHIWQDKSESEIRTKIESGRDGKKVYLNVSKEAMITPHPPESVTVAKPSEPAKPAETAKPESFDSFSVKPPEAKPVTAAKATKTHPQPGPRVGMAMNLACANLTALGKELKPQDVMEITSDLLRIAEWFESGNLCHSYTERNKNKTQQQ